MGLLASKAETFTPSYLARVLGRHTKLQGRLSASICTQRGIHQSCHLNYVLLSIYMGSICYIYAISIVSELCSLFYFFILGRSLAVLVAFMLRGAVEGPSPGSWISNGFIPQLGVYIALIFINQLFTYRYPNDPATELTIAAIEQQKITELRLAKVLGPALQSPVERRTGQLVSHLRAGSGTGGCT